MKAKEHINALKLALTNEQKEREFYLKNAARTNNPVGKAMFQQIAAEEKEHFERLQQLHAKWEKEEKWPVTVPLKVNATAVKAIFQDAIKQTEKMPPGDHDDLQAIRTAIEFESRGVTHYQKLRDSTSDPQEKDFFNLLAEMEREHYLSLKDTEEFLTNPAAWYQKTERSGLDGA